MRQRLFFSAKRVCREAMAAIDPPKRQSRGKRRYRLGLIVGVNASLVLAGLVLLELAFGNWSASYVLPKPALANRNLSYVQTLYEPASVVVHRRDQYGLRGVRQPMSAVELVTIGDSLTAQTFIGEGDTWQDIASALTGVAIANAGIDGMASESAREILEDWIGNIPGLRAKYYLHYYGFNDAGMLQTVSPANRRKRYSWSRRIRGRSAIWQGTQLLRERVFGPGDAFVSRRVIAAPDPPAPLVEVTIQRGEIRAYVEDKYKPNLREILDYHRRRGQIAIFANQLPNPAIVVVKGMDAFVSRPETGRWAAALAEIHKATETICRENPDTCRFIDTAGKLSMEPADYYDAVHYTPRGARKVGEFFAQHLGFIRELKP